MADATVTTPYSNKAPTYLIPVCILGLLALVLVIARIYTRVTRTKRLYLDDWLIIIAEFGQCKPVSSNWESVPDVKCWDNEPIINYGWAVAAMYVIMDLVLSLMPIRLIRTLHRTTSEKILICGLMSLGLFATAVACAKMTTFTSFGKGDPMQATIMPSLWAKLEEEVGIIATSLPCLKRPAENLMKKMGLLKEHELTRPSFVAEVGMSLPTIKEQDARSSADDSLKMKGNTRVDSVAVALGNTKSSSSSEGAKDKAWQAV
ncbi:hypothetical protein N0V83_007869 [Neocucurbitaria cava]|uniref:Rhodopsin domain-containing protein n=1 Tax=Neocucurbitaria cava TaxID=798079 RepID=A0A9W8Y534_9PLEO|nr:hypothetical protein N0V83_007869 [Neocucurbitaria cava]